MIVGLGFRARVGKGEVAKRLVEKHGFVEVAFADALKTACRIIFGLTNAQLYGDDKDCKDAFWDDTPRNILQKVGTECLRRGYRDDVWVKALERVIQREPTWDYVISDCRFPNEALAIQRWGGKLVLITRDDAPTIATKAHASETAMADWRSWDHIIQNDCTLGYLHIQTDMVVEDLRR
jgi:hypothetical protein